MSRVVLLCPDPVGARMRGLGIRYGELARALGDSGADVTLVAPEVEGALAGDLRVRALAPDRVRALRGLLAGADAVLAPPGAPHIMRELRRCGARVAIDLYDPAALEVFERTAGASAIVRTVHATTAVDQLADALRSGDFFICASERQRDLWIGALLSRGLVTARAYERDPTLRSLVDVVAFGIPAAPPPRAAKDPIRERFAQIGDDERVLLWNGGLWAWLDAPAAIAAVAQVRAGGMALRLVFMGASRAGGAEAALAEAQATVAQLGLGDAVLFNDTWVDYAQRGDWLQAADAVISTHRDHLETRFAFRTRLLDCLWTATPAIVTGGDELARRIEAEDLGAVAAPGDVDGLATAIERVLGRGRESYAPRLRAAAAQYEWPRVIAPLRAFVEGTATTTRPPVLTGPAARPLRRTAQRLTRLARAARRG